MSHIGRDSDGREKKAEESFSCSRPLKQGSPRVSTRDPERVEVVRVERRCECGDCCECCVMQAASCSVTAACGTRQAHTPAASESDPPEPVSILHL